MKTFFKISTFIVLLVVIISGCELVMKPTVATASFELAAAPADILTVVLVVTHPDKKTRQTFNIEPEQQIFEEEFEEGTGYLFEMIAVSMTGIYTSSTTVDSVVFTSGYNAGEINADTGDIMYIENRSPITRAADQTENVKLIIEF